MNRRILVVPVLLVALAVAACSGGSRKAGGRGADASNSPPPTYQTFVNCMRQHGMNVPDPDPDSHNLTIAPPPGAGAAWSAALQACQQFLPGGGMNAATDPQQLEALRQYTVCMRAHGVDLTDPDPNTGKGQLQGRFANLSRDQIVNDPTYKAADAACEGPLQSAQPPQKDN